MTLEWEEFLDPYIQAVGELKIKLRGIRKQYRKQNKHSPIEFVTGRVKPIESIKETTGFDLTEVMKANTYDAKTTKNVNFTGLPEEMSAAAKEPETDGKTE